MTYEEAIGVLTYFYGYIILGRGNGKSTLERKRFEALGKAIESLEKQIPKKPIGKTDPMFGDVTTVCPNCGNGGLVNPFVRNRVYGYCPKCGQALDWSEENDNK